MSGGGVPCCGGPVNGSGTSGAPGGAETLAETLALGNVTGGLPIIVSTGDTVRGETILTLEGGAAAVLGPGGDVVIPAGNPAGANQDGGNIELVPTAETGAGTEGTATVGGVSILTDLANAGGGEPVFLGKATPGITGAVGGIAGITGSGGIVASSAGGDIDLDGSGITGATNIKSIEVSRTTNLTITGTPAGLAFNSDVGPTFDPAVYTWSSGASDIEVDVDGDYEIHGELTVVSTSVSESEYIFEWFLNGSPEGRFQRLSTAGSGFDDTPTPVASTIIRSLSDNDVIGIRISRTSGSGGFVDADSSGLSLKRLA